MATSTLPHARAAIAAALERRAAAQAQRLRNEIVQGLSTPGTGRTYATGHKTAPHNAHTASASGDAPAIDTGRLRQSITALKIGPGHWRVGTNLEYALWLEFGTRRMAARPFIRPAVERLRRG